MLPLPLYKDYTGVLAPAAATRPEAGITASIHTGLPRCGDVDHVTTHTLHATQFIARPIDKVFDFLRRAVVLSHRDQMGGGALPVSIEIRAADVATASGLDSARFSSRGDRPSDFGTVAVR